MKSKVATAMKVFSSIVHRVYLSTGFLAPFCNSFLSQMAVIPRSVYTSIAGTVRSFRKIMKAITLPIFWNSRMLRPTSAMKELVIPNARQRECLSTTFLLHRETLFPKAKILTKAIVCRRNLVLSLRQRRDVRAPRTGAELRLERFAGSGFRSVQNEH